MIKLMYSYDFRCVIFVNELKQECKKIWKCSFKLIKIKVELK